MKRLCYYLLLISIFIIPGFVVNAETYDGEYSIEYLLKKYNAVTLGNKKYNLPDKVFFKQNVAELNRRGSITHIDSIDGAVLVNGDCTSANGSSFGANANNVKSFIKGTKGNNVIFNNPLLTNSDYIDFDKMYINIMNQSQSLINEAEYHINNKKLEIDKPGIYTIHNTAGNRAIDNENNNTTNTLLIKNYDRNDIYVFNYFDEYIKYVPNVMIMESGSATAVSLKDFIGSGKYTGNIIFNFPNAKFINVQVFKYNASSNHGWSGNIIAPKAVVFLWCNYREEVSNTYYRYNTYYYGTIISNSIIGDYYDGDTNGHYLKKANYLLNKKIVENNNNYIEDITDYNDDIYTRNYSIYDLLKNYNLVTLEHKQIDSKSKLLQFGNTPGSIKMFHIAGPVLISGDLYGKVYANEVDNFFNTTNNKNYYNRNIQKFDRVAFDLESNEVTESYIKGKYYTNVSDMNNSVNYNMSIAILQPWDNMENDNINYYDHKNNLFFGNRYNYQQFIDNMYPEYGYGFDNYINFDRLYNNIVAEQRGIDEGTKVNSSDGVAHIPIGGNYVIDDINDINKIVFDNFEDNKKMITVVTIKNSGDINFPEINRDSGAYKGIVTNDYFGKEKATHLYEVDTFINEDSYYGNIIFNVPNATYIKLAPNAPFAGHLIAPNADVETPETHFAGCFIVNSIYGEGNTEAHFYPLTAYDNCECSVEDQVPEKLQARFNELRLSRLLGGEKSTIEKVVIGDQDQYRKDTEQLNSIIDNCPLKRNDSSIVQILTNPKTYSTIGIVIGIILLLLLGIKIFNKKKKTV